MLCDLLYVWRWLWLFFESVVCVVRRSQRAGSNRATPKHRYDSTHTQLWWVLCLFVECACWFLNEQEEPPNTIGDNPPSPAVARQVEPASGKPRPQHGLANPPPSPWQATGFHCVLAVAPQVRRELPGSSSVDEGLAAYQGLLS